MSLLQKTNSGLQEGFHCNKLNIEMNKKKNQKTIWKTYYYVYLRTHISVRGC